MEENESHMKLQCRWDKSNLFLESPPPDAQTKLNICLVKGDSRFDNFKNIIVVIFLVP